MAIVSASRCTSVVAMFSLATLTGIFLAAGAPEQRDQAQRMLDLVMDGLRPGTG